MGNSSNKYNDEASRWHPHHRPSDQTYSTNGQTQALIRHPTPLSFDLNEATCKHSYVWDSTSLLLISIPEGLTPPFQSKNPDLCITPLIKCCQ